MIRVWRKKKQEELADEARVSTTTVSKCENGRPASPKLAQKFAKALDVDLEMLDQNITLIPVPERWSHIHKEPRVKTIIDSLLEMTSKELSNLFHWFLEKGKTSVKGRNDG